MTPFERLFRNRWPNGANCADCGGALVASPRTEKVRCSECKRHAALFEGTTVEGFRLKPAQWIVAANSFAAARKGVSVRRFAKAVGVAEMTGEKLLRSLRKVVRERWEPNMKTPRSILLSEVEVGRRLFRLNPPLDSKGNYRVLIMCAVIPVLDEKKQAERSPKAPTKEEIARARTPSDLGEVQVDLLTVSKDPMEHAKKWAPGAFIHTFKGSPLVGDMAHDEKEFINSDKHPAGAQFQVLTDTLRELLVTRTHGRLNNDLLNDLLAEFRFRWAHRKRPAIEPANTLLELMMAERDSVSIH